MAFGGELRFMRGNWKSLIDYFRKMKGTSESPPRVSSSEIFWSSAGAFLGIVSLTVTNYKILDGTDLVMVIGSFGASAVLVYGAAESPLAQPRNLIGGHVISAIVGVTAYQLLDAELWLGAPLAVSAAIAAMRATRTLHPPGGGTALIAVIGSAKIHALGYLFVIIPTGVGAILILVVALLVNNMPKNKQYPKFWH